MTDICDLRSDTFTLPTEEMRKAIWQAEVGDDVYGEDPTVNRLEEMGAEISGKEASLFVSSGCMGNLIAIALQAGRGTEVLCAAESHIVCHEIGALASLAATQPTVVPSDKDGRIIPGGLESYSRARSYDMADRALLEIENTTSGVPYDLAAVDQMTAWAKENNMLVHMDGARIFNAQVATGIPVSRWARDCDSITFCLSKGLGAPMGSLLCGSRDFILHARRMRKLLGGGMRQIGFMAAAGIWALENNVERLAEDHANADLIAKAVEDAGWATIERKGTNMVFFRPKKATAAEVVAHMREKGVLVLEEAGMVRAVTSINVTRTLAEKAAAAIKEAPFNA